MEAFLSRGLCSTLPDTRSPAAAGLLGGFKRFLRGGYVLGWIERTVEGYYGVRLSGCSKKDAAESAACACGSREGGRERLGTLRGAFRRFSRTLETKPSMRTYMLTCAVLGQHTATAEEAISSHNSFYGAFDGGFPHGWKMLWNLGLGNSMEICVGGGEKTGIQETSVVWYAGPGLFSPD